MVRRCHSDTYVGYFESAKASAPTSRRDLRGTVLNVSYKTKEWKAVCTKIDQAQSLLGPQAAAELHELLAEAESFLTADELIEFRDGEMSEGDSLSFPFGTHYRARFKPVGENLPRNDDGSVAWGQVRRIMLIEISQ